MKIKLFKLHENIEWINYIGQSERKKIRTFCQKKEKKDKGSTNLFVNFPKADIFY